jgi:hypothetical protein
MVTRDGQAWGMANEWPELLAGLTGRGRDHGRLEDDE